MSEELFVSQSAPTLAGIKTGNLFTAEFVNHEIAMDEIRQLNVSLTPKGVRVIPLRESKNRMLIYVYRPNCLQVDFTNEDLLEMLRNLKYPVSNPERCIVCLAQRLRECEVFPHEIGLFLGYPPEDVKGFIENKAQNYKIAYAAYRLLSAPPDYPHTASPAPEIWHRRIREPAAAHS